MKNCLWCKMKSCMCWPGRQICCTHYCAKCIDSVQEVIYSCCRTAMEYWPGLKKRFVQLSANWVTVKIQELSPRLCKVRCHTVAVINNCGSYSTNCTSERRHLLKEFGGWNHDVLTNLVTIRSCGLNEERTSGLQF